MLSLAKFIKKEIELRENLVGTGFIAPPDDKSDFNNRVTVVGDIVSTVGFEAAKQYVFYELLIPEEGGWAFEDYNQYEMQGIGANESTSEFNKRKSVTHVSVANVEASTDSDDPEGTQMVSHFCFPFDYQFLAK